jgi:hypothetical protein
MLSLLVLFRGNSWHNPARAVSHMFAMPAALLNTNIHLCLMVHVQPTVLQNQSLPLSRNSSDSVLPVCCCKHST